MDIQTELYGGSQRENHSGVVQGPLSRLDHITGVAAILERSQSDGLEEIIYKLKLYFIHFGGQDFC